jgi:calcium-dependent protein kinase
MLAAAAARVASDFVLLLRFACSWEPFNSVSELCKEFIRSLIVVDVGSRMTIDQALEHPWVKELGEDNVLDRNIFSSLKNFTSVRKFKKVALQVLSQKVSADEKVALKQEFDKLDTDASGALSLEELRQGFSRAGSEGERDIANIMKEVDADGSGAIDYNEFLQAMMHVRSMPWKLIACILHIQTLSHVLE